MLEEMFPSPKCKSFKSNTHSYLLEAEPKIGYTAADSVEEEENMFKTRILWSNREDLVCSCSFTVLRLLSAMSTFGRGGGTDRTYITEVKDRHRASISQTIILENKKPQFMK